MGVVWTNKSRFSVVLFLVLLYLMNFTYLFGTGNNQDGVRDEGLTQSLFTTGQDRMENKVMRSARSTGPVTYHHGDLKNHHDNHTFSSFIVITTVFNPVGYSSRYEHYETFSKYIKKSGVRLITVEAIFPSLNQTKFQVTSPHNPDHIQIRSPSVFWMKENLINIAVSRLAKDPSVKYICWMDSDIMFEEGNWVGEIIKGLGKYAFVQGFKFAEFIGEFGEIERLDYGFGYKVAKYGETRGVGVKETPPQPGYIWATTPSIFMAMGGLPTSAIIGGGDQHFAYALLNKLRVAAKFTPELKSQFLARGQLLYKNLKNWMKSTKDKRQIVGYAPLHLTHRFHGTVKNRNYVGRWEVFIKYGVNVDKDMRMGEGGVLEFVEGREDLENDIIAYFRSRKED